MQVCFTKFWIETNCLFELAQGVIPILSLGLQRTECVAQGRAFGSSNESAFGFRYREFSLLAGGKRAYIENHHARRQRTDDVLIERSKQRQ